MMHHALELVDFHLLHCEYFILHDVLTYIGLHVPLFLQSIEGLTAEVEHVRRQPSPLAAAQAAKQEVLADQRKFQEVIAGNQVCFLCYQCLGGVKLFVC
jgi:hypothetical protein